MPVALAPSVLDSTGISRSGPAWRATGRQMPRLQVQNRHLFYSRSRISSVLTRDSTGFVKDVHPWAIALSGDGQYLAGVSESGRVGVWDLSGEGAQIRDHETKGSFGTCIDLVGSLSHC